MLQTFQYQNSPITFSNGSEVMVNATEMAKKFGKQPAAFLRNAQTEAFIGALQNRIPDACLVETINGGATFGTWMHQKLALKFAGWLSPDFELWMLDRIEELLTTGKTELQPMDDSLIVARALQITTKQLEAATTRAKIAEQNNEMLEAHISEIQPKANYAMAVLDADHAYTATEVGSQIGMSAKKLNDLLHGQKVIRKVNSSWVINAQYADRGLHKYRTKLGKDSHGNPKSYTDMLWTETGRLFIHGLFNKQLNPSTTLTAVA